ncbi:hypothetical protein DT250_22435 [Bacillus sp. AR2-1]|nr:hypothetical protein DT250_22435 [Bacillus sp. AR2-1]
MHVFFCYVLSISRYSVSNRRYIEKIFDVSGVTIDIIEKSSIYLALLNRHNKWRVILLVNEAIS